MFTSDPTPYAVGKAAGCKPQMVYNYVKNNLIKGAYRDDEGKIRIPAATAEAWVTKRTTKAIDTAPESVQIDA